MSIELIQKYNEVEKALYNHVEFTPDWVMCPISDCTDSYWELDDNEIRYADSKEELESREGNYYTNEIYKQRFYSKWVYTGKELTMVFCDPHTDGVKWFKFFDNTKRII